MAQSKKSGKGGATPRKTAKGGHRSVIPPDELNRTDRRQDILRSAELLFSQRGYHAVPVRDIAEHANVPLALVGYYFGKKHELLQTIFEHRKSNITERIEGIRKVDCSSKNHHAVEDIIRAWLEPVIRLSDSPDDQPFPILVARVTWEPGVEARYVISAYYDQLAEVFIDTMCKVLPGVHRDKVVWAYEFSLGALLMLVADTRVERLSRHGAKSGDRSQSDYLTGFLTAGFLSALSREKK